MDQGTKGLGTTDFKPRLLQPFNPSALQHAPPFEPRGRGITKETKVAEADDSLFSLLPSVQGFGADWFGDGRLLTVEVHRIRIREG